MHDIQGHREEILTIPHNTHAVSTQIKDDYVVLSGKEPQRLEDEPRRAAKAEKAVRHMWYTILKGWDTHMIHIIEAWSTVRCSTWHEGVFSSVPDPNPRGVGRGVQRGGLAQGLGIRLFARGGGGGSDCEGILGIPCYILSIEYTQIAIHHKWGKMGEKVLCPGAQRPKKFSGHC